MRIEYHRSLIGDQVRNAAFQAALARVIEPGVTTVADIGAGTGLLGLMAARLGARQVFLYESAEVASVAARVLKRNRASNCHLFPCHSTAMQDPPRVDVVVSETLGNYPLEEDLLSTMADARKRFLKPKGQLIPKYISQVVAPVVSAHFHEDLIVWARTGQTLGIDLSPAMTMSLNNVYVRAITPADLLNGIAGARIWDEIVLDRSEKAARRGEARWPIIEPTTVYGFATWWDAELIPGVTLSTSPSKPRTHWEQLYFPLVEPLSAVSGETVGLNIRSRTTAEGGTHLAWTAEVCDAEDRPRLRLSMDLDKGYLP